MPIVTLRDLYVAELQDLYDVEQQVLQVLPGMAARATSGELRTAFERHYEQTQVQIERLDLLFRQLNERAVGPPCEAIRGIVMQAHRRSAETERGEVLDAALIAAAQRIEHYEIASYGCVRTYAQVLGDHEASRILGQTLEEEGEMDQDLTAVASGGINQEAGADLTPRATTYQSRLRYVAASDLPSFRYADRRIVNKDRDDLGRIDGFIVDDDTGRPVYHVVDSGGWFSGRRYVLPVAQLEADEANGTFATELTREQLRRYPEFSPSAFIAMDDEDASRYERRLIEAVLPYHHLLRRGERPHYEELPLYQPPAWLMAGMWMTDPAIVSGAVAAAAAAAEAQRNAADQPPPHERRKARQRRSETTAPAAAHDDRTEAGHGAERDAREQLIARGAPDANARPAAEKDADTGKPRIEKYYDR
jgi:ferritin-like metal-binding protein YciE